MADTISKSFSEVYDIINHLEENLLKKIPKSFIKIIEEQRDKTYKVNIDYSKNINEQALFRETKVILSLIYRDYIVEKDERKKLVDQENKRIQSLYEINFQKRNQKIKERIAKENLQNNNIENYALNENTLKDNKEELSLLDQNQEKWYRKILEKLRKIFKIL